MEHLSDNIALCFYNPKLNLENKGLINTKLKCITMFISIYHAHQNS